MRFVFIHAHERIWHITTMCRVLAVSRAGYYAWRARPLCQRIQDDAVLYAKVQAIHERTRRRYGSPRVHRELRNQGCRCGEKRVARLMRTGGLRGTPRRAYRVTTQSAHAAPVAPNRLDRQFDVATIPDVNRAWAADITYVPTGEGWLYLAVILDLKSRRVVGWAVRSRMAQELTLAALTMALTHRAARGVLHHSDRGVQYASYAYQALLASAGATASMSRIGDCWDNAVVESFFATVTKELLADGAFATRAAARAAIAEFIEIWYNRQRLHSALGYVSPAAYEAQLGEAA
jgi:transposase InsO family protein